MAGSRTGAKGGRKLEAYTTLSLAEDADFVGLAVADVDAAVFVGVDAVGAGHFAFEGVGGGAVAFFAGAGDEFDVAGFGVDHADGVAFAVGEPDVALCVDGDAFGAGEGGVFGGAAVACEAAFAGAGDVVDEAGFEV